MNSVSLSLFAQATTRSRLDSAWRHVQKRAEDSASESVARFAKDADRRLGQLVDELASGSYLPGPLHSVEIPKRDGSSRTLRVPTVRDRVVERAVMEVVAPIADRYLGPAAYAYREGIGVGDAVQAVVALRDEGLSWVLRADVDDCFDSIPKDVAVRRLKAVLPDGSLDDLIDRFTGRLVATRRGEVESRGVPQGTALSPLLANLVLVDLDDALLDRGMPVVRYADDFVVVAQSRDACWEAARVATAVLEEMGMTLGADKTEVMSFDEGFCFLGEDFGPRYPPALDGLHRVEVPTRRVLYCARQGSRLFTKAGRLVVESKDDTELISVPKNLVSRIVTFGAIGVAAGTRSWTLEEGIDVVYLSRRGSYLGQQLSAADGTRVRRLRSQIEFACDDDRAMPVVRQMIDSKIGHQITLLQRFGRPEQAEVVEAAVNTARQMRLLLPDAKSDDEILGLEGAAAAAYFSAYGQLFPPELAFDQRTRRPPMDVANSALGYGYALLASECVSALVSAGLDPNVGLLHAASGRRPGLALDFMEELRPLVVDQVVLAAARRGALLPSHGAPIKDRVGVYLTKSGKSALVRAYEQRMLQVTAGAIADFRGSWRRHLYRQAKLLMRTFTGSRDSWSGMSWR